MVNALSEMQTGESEGVSEGVSTLDTTMDTTTTAAAAATAEAANMDTEMLDTPKQGEVAGMQQPEQQPGVQTNSIDSDSMEQWTSELEQLAAMGFVNVARNVELLERYRGRMLRVVNLLSGGD